MPDRLFEAVMSNYPAWLEVNVDVGQLTAGGFMFNSAAFEVAIGVVFVFLLVSILCTAIREGLEGFLKTRAAYLEYGIRELLQDLSGKGMAAWVFNHPLVYGLYAGTYAAPSKQEKPGVWARGYDLPSYIPSSNFAQALMDIMARGPDPKQQNDAGAPIISLDQMRAGIAQLGNGPVQRVLLTAIDTAQGDLDRVQKNIEAWYDSAMDRVSGKYKRSSQMVLFIVGLAVAVAGNINAITIAQYLYQHGPARAILMQQAQNAVGDPEFQKKTYGEVKGEIDALALPIGWERTPVSISNALHGLAGWLLTALAAMLGAPFWFDVLNKFMVIRSTVKPHEKSREEGSEDRPATASVDQLAPVGTGGFSAAVPRVADCCDVDMTVNPTYDEHLPPARGGVGAPAGNDGGKL